MIVFSHQNGLTLGTGTVSNASELIHRIYEFINEGRLDRVEEVLEADYVDHDDGSVGVEAFRHRIAGFRAAFPDLRVTVDQVLEDGEYVASRTTTTGTHDEPLFGIPATGRRVELTGVDIVRVSSNGRAAERWGGLNTYSLLKQLGAIPAPS